MSQAPEDRATTPRWRVLPQIVLSRRERLVSRFGQNDVNVVDARAEGHPRDWVGELSV